MTTLGEGMTPLLPLPTYGAAIGIPGLLMKDEGLDDVLVTAGGIIPDDDVPALTEAGVARVFGPGTTIAEVAEYLRANARPRD